MFYFRLELHDTGMGLRSANQRAWLWWILCTSPVLCSDYQGNRAFVTAGKQAQCPLLKSLPYPLGLFLPAEQPRREEESIAHLPSVHETAPHMAVHCTASEVYFDALENLIGSLHTYHRDVIILVYDLGLSPGAGADAIPWAVRKQPFCERLTARPVLWRVAEQLRQAQSFANCVVINFAVEVYPKHVRPPQARAARIFA